MPENVSFNAIPADIRTPGQYIEIDTTMAVSGPPQMEYRILVMGQKLATGIQAAGIPVRVLSALHAEQLFGSGSLLHLMLAAAREANSYTDTWAVALEDDLAAVAATGSITFTGAVAESGTLSLYVAGRQVKARVRAGDSNSTIAATVAAALTATGGLPVAATVDDSIPEKVVFVARNGGETGNAIDVRIGYYRDQRTPRGLGVIIEPMAGGSGNPDVAAALTAIGDDQYYTIITPWTDSANMVALEEELDERWGPMQQTTGHAFCGLSGSHATLSTWGSDRNTPHVSCLGIYDSPTPPWVWAATWAAVVQYHGAIDPARPFQTLPLPGLLPPPEESRFTREERNLLLFDGISTFTVDQGGMPRIERVITTLQTNAWGLPDTSLLDLEAKWTVDYFRYAVRHRIATRYPRHKLASDGTHFAPGQAIVTPRMIRAELVALFRELEEAGLVEGLDQFKADLLVVRSNTDPNRVNAVLPPDIANQFRIFAAAVQFRL